jgi:VIT1/CCC1 family predicted Fe2+/Mn2+ transporter
MKRKFWWIVFWIIAVISYGISLYGAITVPEEGLEPFFIINLGMLCVIPTGIAQLRGEYDFSQPEENPKTKKKGKYSKRLLLYTAIASIITALLGRVPVFTFKELLAIFISTILALVLLDFFFDFLPKKLGIED